MAVDISEYLDAIAGDNEGEEVIIAIHDAALKLNTDAYKTADIDTLLNSIKLKIFGKDIRMDIYEILKRLSETEPEPGPSGGDVYVLTGTATLVLSGSLAELTDIGIISGIAEMEE